MKLFLAMALAALGTAADAASAEFDVTLAGLTLGRISIEAASADVTLRSTLDNTPLGVGDGQFVATSTGGKYYRGVETSPGETRAIEIEYDGPRVARVAVSPESEATDASDPAAVPPGTSDPARGFARIALARDCVDPYRIYDGRRVVTISPTTRTLTADGLVCEYAYTVTVGPGHLSPLRFRRVAVSAIYAVSNGAVSGIREIGLGAGPFTVRLLQR
ncbi:hypothetical protein LX81_02613 [Palleronia aestuarii]|uniref:DUF3108 domain-containing protein n=1 Tax=Palleronia aestuarii TaxID=568105 RepID=A0A2W7N3S3_9RHOB|nr:hypothetical protein [Palleronia aestuarii]PZX15025.1 hypothetical protein LX81_02613 [Palleronia aestuarii]